MEGSCKRYEYFFHLSRLSQADNKVDKSLGLMNILVVVENGESDVSHLKLHVQLMRVKQAISHSIQIAMKHFKITPEDERMLADLLIDSAVADNSSKLLNICDRGIRLLGKYVK